MSIQMYNLAQILANAKFGQDLYAMFQGTEESQRRRRAQASTEHVEEMDEKVGEIEKVEASDEIKVNEDGHAHHGNFSEFFEKVRDRFEEQKKSREARPEDNPEDSGQTIDFIA